MERKMRFGACTNLQKKDEGDDSDIDTAQTPKRFRELLALSEKIWKIFTDSIQTS